MCRWCEKAASDSRYKQLISSMHADDQDRLEHTCRLASSLESIVPVAYSSIRYPVPLLAPFFDARAAYSVPHNYYQPLLVDGQPLGVAFAHGSMRSVFFSGSRLMVFSKNVHHTEGQEFFSSFLLLHLEKSEYAARLEGEALTLSCDITKAMKNLLTGQVEKKRIAFHFVHQPIASRFVTKDQLTQSGHLKAAYEKYGGHEARLASVDIEGFAITVPHFAPHPYLLQEHGEFGFDTPRAMQEMVLEYFRAHLERVEG